ncbi:unnamed protein product [Diabrotica balteata]|uniref:ATP-binding cassette sub-family G member 5 n=1 Tax=Diabrotica balteata TaxID=107213 RepID=A0A9N9TFN3_DIABA|nr:unnamed protein product [Diabrotica balteata]
MLSGGYILELCNVFFSGQVEKRSLVQRMVGNIKTGVILKDVSMLVHSGEVLAVLGSKGSGKKALLDVISRRAQGPIRGQIYLNNHPVSMCLFQQKCAYVTHKCDFIPGLNVEQTLYYIPTKFTGYLKMSKVKQVIADLALSQVAKKCVEDLTKSEYRRLMIGVQLIKNPVVLLLDEPTWDLDPLNTYLIISILSNAAKKYGTAIILTMEKPRSDVFPFLDRVLYLCLGDVVYTGGTKQMLEYFNVIGFPCPQLENPLMYYLCLSTVDRRSRERFVESNYQIAALVEKFKNEGVIFQKSPSMISPNQNHEHGQHDKVPFMHGRPGRFSTAWTIYVRLLAATVSFKRAGLRQTFLRTFALPLYFFLMWLFYREMKDWQHTFISRNGLILNCLCCVYFVGIINTILMYPTYRTRYYQDTQEGLYGGTLFLLTYNLVSLPFSFISSVLSAVIIFPLIMSFDNPVDFVYFTLILWACYIFAEQQTMAILMIVKDYMKAAIFSIYLTVVCITLGSGILRSMKGLPDWLYYASYGTQTRYAAAYLNRKVFTHLALNRALPFDLQHNCTQISFETSILNGANNAYCRYASGQAFLTERYSRDPTEVIFSGVLEEDFNIGLTCGFALGMIVFNLFLYLIPLPSFVKAKFRE